MAIKKDTLDDLLAGRDPKAVFSKDGLFDELKKALAERVLNAELDDHLDTEAAEGSRNRGNGSSKKTILTETSRIDVRIPRDRDGTFDPKLIQRYQRRFPGFDDKIVSMYARGMTVREIQGHLLELYGLEVSPDLISTVTDAVLETVAEWQNRPLETSYPLVFFDAIRVKIRDEGLVRNKAVYLALGVAADGTKDILGLWIETTEGAKFWLKVMNDLKARGVEDILYQFPLRRTLGGFPNWRCFDSVSRTQRSSRWPFLSERILTLPPFVARRGGPRMRVRRAGFWPWRRSMMEQRGRKRQRSAASRFRSCGTGSSSSTPMARPG